MPACHAGGREFEPRRPRQSFEGSLEQSNLPFFSLNVRKDVLTCHATRILAAYGPQLLTIRHPLHKLQLVHAFASFASSLAHSTGYKSFLYATAFTDHSLFPLRLLGCVALHGQPHGSTHAHASSVVRISGRTKQTLSSRPHCRDQGMENACVFRPAVRSLPSRT